MCAHRRATPGRRWAFGLTLAGLAALPLSALLDACGWSLSALTVTMLSIPTLLYGLLGCAFLAAEGGWLRTAMRVGPGAFVIGALALVKLELVAASSALWVTAGTVGTAGALALLFLLLARGCDDLPDL